MRKLSAHLIVVVIQLCCYSALNAQSPGKFSKDPNMFIQEIIALFKDDNSVDKKTRDEMIVNVTAFWNNRSFDEKAENLIYDGANYMLKNKMKPFPDYALYFNTVIDFNKSNQTEKSFLAWLQILQKVISEKSKRSFIAFLEKTDRLIIANILYQSNAVVWKAGSSDFYFDYDTVPKVVFYPLDLTCYSSNDSMVIYETQGIFYPLTDKWVGKGGKVLWERSGFMEDEVRATLKKYEVFLKYSKYTSDSATLYNKFYFNKPLLGVISDKVVIDAEEEKMSYPRFSSYNTHLKIEKIFDNIDYEGGFSMNGSRFIGSGYKDKKAKITFKRDGRKFIVATSGGFSIRKDKIASDRAAITIYYEKDSIYHPGLILKYLDENKELSLIRQGEGLIQSPYFDTYHKIDMYVEALYWKMDEPKIDMRMIKGPSSTGNALFESCNFYSDSRFDMLQGIDEINPLYRVWNYSRKTKSREVPLDAFTEYVRLPREQVKIMLMTLANMGFLNYDIVHDQALIKDRLFEFLAAKNKKTDYDILQFNSVIGAESNATLNLLNFDMKVRGVAQVNLSSVQRVFIYPENQEITLKKNRDFLFSGTIHAGRFDFYARVCAFDYDKFKLNMTTIDSLSFKVQNREYTGSGSIPLVRVRNVLQDLTGDLFIDNPTNKSGVKEIPDYPIFNSKKDSYVYFDKKNIEGGVYKRNNFYYHVKPFVIDSLDDFVTENMEFNGYLSSAGIFQDINEPLRVMDDYSLGFIRMTSASGYAAYSGKGTFFDEIKLSNRGLRGKGSLRYLTSTTLSDDFKFYPDSMNTLAKQYTVKEQVAYVQYPEVTAEDVKVHWRPYRDVMRISNTSKPIAMYKSQSNLNGVLYLTPSLMSGAGTMDFSNAVMDAQLYRFKQHEFDSDTADFRLKAYDLNQFALTTKNYKSHIDFDERKGQFKSNGGGSMVVFPVNQYICYMDEFEWFMDREEIAFENKQMLADKTGNITDTRELADLELSGSEFISIHPAQDSLRFYSPKARYNLKDNIIRAEKVQIIKVADAAIYPDLGNVTIYKKAQMETFKNAKILANTATKFHEIYDATVDIYSRQKYSANGYYDYIDENKKKQKIFFDVISVDSTQQTFANGYINDQAGFTLSPDYDYSGNIKMIASDEFLLFDGAFRIKPGCDSTIAVNWVKFKSFIDPSEIYIPLDNPLKDINNLKLFPGVFYNNTDKIYPAFLNPKRFYSDSALVKSGGFVYYDKQEKEYRIASQEKLKQEILPESYLSLSKKNCSLYGEGRISVGANFGQMKMMNYGKVFHFPIADSTYMQMVMVLDFFFNDDAMKYFSDVLENYSGLEAIDVTEDNYYKALAYLIGIEEADKLMADANLYGYFKKFPSKLTHTLYLTNVNMKWDSRLKSFVSDGTIGVGSVGKTQVNKYVFGRIEIVRKRGGDVLTMYLEVDPEVWFFFTYSKGLLQALSSDAEFNKPIIEAKPDKRQLKGKAGEPAIRYVISTERKKKDFLKKLGISDEEEQMDEDTPDKPDNQNLKKEENEKVNDGNSGNEPEKKE